MKILVIFTGGTIGSTLNDGWISPDSTAKRTLIDYFEKTVRNDITFITKAPYTVLSENLCARHINLLIKTLKESLAEQYDGIIVTHGTDTLQYSSAALGYAFGDDIPPIILVSANYPLNDPRSNGHSNFAAAVRFIEEKAGTGVFVAYRNGDNNVLFHRSDLLFSHCECDDSVFSIFGNHYAIETDSRIEITEKSKHKSTELGEFTLVDSPEILAINAYPGEIYNYSPEKYKAVILRPYHSGTLNTDNESFIAFCEDAYNKRIPVFLVNATVGETYETSKEFSRLHLIPVFASTFISTYMRLWIAVSRNEDIRKVF